MVRTFLKVYMELGSSFLFLQEQIKDIIIHHLTAGERGDATYRIVVKIRPVLCGAHVGIEREVVISCHHNLVLVG